MASRAEEISKFWLGLSQKQHFSKDKKLDAEISQLFQEDIKKAQTGAYDSWLSEPVGCLALVILLDQMSRNTYRQSPEMYAGDAKAREVSRHAIDKGFDKEVEGANWFYMPFMHSENLEDQKISVNFFTRKPESESAHFALHHQGIVQRFGRFPHRNAILGRESTPEELKFLEEKGFSG